MLSVQFGKHFGHLAIKNMTVFYTLHALFYNCLWYPCFGSLEGWARIE